MHKIEISLKSWNDKLSEALDKVLNKLPIRNHSLYVNNKLRSVKCITANHDEGKRLWRALMFNKTNSTETSLVSTPTITVKATFKRARLCRLTCLYEPHRSEIKSRRLCIYTYVTQVWESKVNHGPSHASISYLLFPSCSIWKSRLFLGLRHL